LAEPAAFVQRARPAGATRGSPGLISTGVVRQGFKPDFSNRLDEIVLFDALDTGRAGQDLMTGWPFSTSSKKFCAVDHL
jgi:hypothetical protein